MTSNIKPNAIFTCDNLSVLESMDDECIDLVYLDPPFNSGRSWKGAPGHKVEDVEFKDTWSAADIDADFMARLADMYPITNNFISAIKIMHGESMHAYVAFITQRLFELHRVLKPTGSLYLHIDPTASHYLKIVMDLIFGKENYRNEIVWCYEALGRTPTDYFHRKSDAILFYAKSPDAKFKQHYIWVDRSAKMFNKRDKDGRLFRTLGGRGKYYLDEWNGVPIPNWWADIGIVRKTEKNGYPTQKPCALLERIICASSNEGDIVLDPFCGSATTCVAAQLLGRKWIGIDISSNAVPVIRKRISKEVGDMLCDFTHYTEPPKQTDEE